MLLNQILSRQNLILALKRVERNKGSHGVDRMPYKTYVSTLSKIGHPLKRQFLQEPMNQCQSAESKSRNPTATFGY